MKYYLIKHILKDCDGGEREYKLGEYTSLDKARHNFIFEHDPFACITYIKVVDDRGKVYFRSHINKRIKKFLLG